MIKFIIELPLLVKLVRMIYRAEEEFDGTLGFPLKRVGGAVREVQEAQGHSDHSTGEFFILVRR